MLKVIIAQENPNLNIYLLKLVIRNINPINIELSELWNR